MTGVETLTAVVIESIAVPFGPILSLSKDEAAARPVDASSFDRLRMGRLLTLATAVRERS